MKRILIIITVIMCFMVTVEAKDKKKYLALGDSITYGYSLADHEKQCFPALFAEENNLDLTNKGVVGYEAWEIQVQMKDINLNEYDVITLCAGANDILGYIMTELEDEIYEILGGDNSYRDIFNVMKKVIFVTDTDEFKAKISNRLIEFDKTFKEIIVELKETKAELYVLNVYNPYKGIPFIGDISDGYVKRLNSIIDKNTKDCKLIDIYTAFNENDTQLTNASLAARNIDPHPNVQGQIVIFEELNKAYAKDNTLVIGLVCGGAGLVILGGTLTAFIMKKRKIRG